MKNHTYRSKSRTWEKMSGRKGIWFHLAGIIAIVWFLIRVVPKPQRAQYPVFATNYFQGEQPAATSWNPIPKQPMGVGTGVNPGRVVWVWNPNATEKDVSGYWWEQENNNQDVIDQMLSIGVQQLTGTSNNSDAWNAIFRYFNQVHGNGDIGYQPGEKIAIKLNFNNALGGTGDPYFKEDNDRDASPYVVKALLYQLVHVIGVAQEDIILFDASRPIPDWFYNRVYYETYPADPLVEEFSSIHYVDSLGEATGREQVVPSSTKMYFSNGVVRTLPTCIVDANYLINMPLLKRHPINMGVTLSGKNFFGSFIEPVSDIHAYDPVALDSVMYDFLLTEGTNPIEGAQNYLHQAAVPASNVYDPEHDGTYLSTSLGVHEHWDRTVNIFSAERYVGPSENGIDYLTYGEEFVHPGAVFVTPQEKHLYLFGEDKGAFPFTTIIGKIDVEAQVNVFSGTVQKIEFYIDNTLQFTDTEAPYIWIWNKLSFFKHTIKVIAYYNSIDSTSNQISVLKIF